MFLVLFKIIKKMDISIWSKLKTLPLNLENMLISSTNKQWKNLPNSQLTQSSMKAMVHKELMKKLTNTTKEPLIMKEII
jgi:hypothetical protein